MSGEHLPSRSRGRDNDTLSTNSARSSSASAPSTALYVFVVRCIQIASRYPEFLFVGPTNIDPAIQISAILRILSDVQD